MISLDLTPKALGTNILLLSMLIDTHQPIEIRSTESGIAMFGALKKIFNINDNQLTLTKADITDSISGSITDCCKLFSPFIKRSKPITGKKPCVGISWFSGPDCYNDADCLLPNTSFPYNRHYSMEQYQQVFKLLKANGYDVITFDTIQTNLEQKAHLLEEYCEFVITYEGGLAILAHTLGIPSIILPWHHSPTGSAIQGYWPTLYCQSIHLTKDSWFLPSVDLLSNMSGDQLFKIVELCKNQQGNNLFFQAERFTVDENLQECRLFFSNQVLKFKTVLSDWERNFIQTYIPNRHPVN